MESFKEKLSIVIDFVKRRWPWVLAGFIVFMILMGWGAGYLTQMKVYGIGNSFSEESGQKADPNLFRNLAITYGTKAGFNTLLTMFVIIAMVAVVIVVMRKFEDKGETDPDRNFEYSKKNTYGTSGWMTKKEMLTALDVKKASVTYGTILGAVVGTNDVVSVVPTIRKDSKIKFTEADRQKSMRTNKHICVLGASGSMKSRAYVRNAIFQCARREESLIITDPKGEMYEDTAEMLRREGYNVKVFNLKDQIYSDSWDCLAEVTDEVMAQVFCSVIIQNTGGAKGDHFWDNAEMNLLKALVLYVTMVHPKLGLPVTMAEVYKILSTKTVTELEAMFKKKPMTPTHPAYVPYSIYAQAGDNVRGNVVIGLASRIQVFQSQITKNITSYPEIDLTLPGKEKCAYYCAISDQDATFTFLSSLFFAFLFIKLVKYADNYGKNPGKLDVPVNFILDEFSNIGQIPDFEKKISTVRSRDINISVIIQNIPQLKSRYPNDVWQEIIGNCDTQLFLGCTDETTAKYISDRSGVATIDIQSEQTVRKTLAVAQFVPDYKKTDSVGKRNVLTPDEVLRLPGKQALVIIRGEKILKVDKYDFSRHPWAQKMAPCRMSARIPRWHRREIEAEIAGYELRTNNGSLLYWHPESNVYYERTAFINASDEDELRPIMPKGECPRVDIERTSGLQVVLDDDGEVAYNEAGYPMIVNVQTGEIRTFYGFDSRGDLLDRPQTNMSDADNMVEIVEVSHPEPDPEESDEGVEAKTPDPNESKTPKLPRQMFDSLIAAVTRRHGTASLDQDMLEPQAMTRKNEASRAAAGEEMSFARAPQGAGAVKSANDQIFAEPEDDGLVPEDNWISEAVLASHRGELPTEMTEEYNGGYDEYPTDGYSDESDESDPGDYEDYGEYDDYNGYDSDYEDLPEPEPEPEQEPEPQHSADTPKSHKKPKKASSYDDLFEDAETTPTSVESRRKPGSGQPRPSQQSKAPESPAVEEDESGAPYHSTKKRGGTPKQSLDLFSLTPSTPAHKEPKQTQPKPKPEGKASPPANQEQSQRQSPNKSQRPEQNQRTTAQSGQKQPKPQPQGNAQGGTPKKKPSPAPTPITGADILPDDLGEYPVEKTDMSEKLASVDPSAYLPDTVVQGDNYDQGGTSLSAAEIEGELRMAKGHHGQKKRRSGNYDSRDNRDESVEVSSSDYGTVDRDSDWGYAFVTGDDLFD